MIKGPVSLGTLKALVNSGKVLPQDECAACANGPWFKVGSIVRESIAKPRVVESFRIKRGMFGRGFYAEYNCLNCGDPLRSEATETTQAESCPRCGLRFHLSPRVSEQVNALRAEAELKQAQAVAAAEEKRRRRLAEQKAKADRLGESQRDEKNREAMRAAQDAITERWHLENAAIARQRMDGCWYCGLRQSTKLPMCFACGRINQRSSRLEHT
jgi:DNA-directed RNA polymerase subunit RPC12/RpoP